MAKNSCFQPRKFTARIHPEIETGGSLRKQINTAKIDWEDLQGKIETRGSPRKKMRQGVHQEKKIIRRHSEKKIETGGSPRKQIGIAKIFPLPPPRWSTLYWYYLET